jgi:hypothetical protein
MVRSGLLLSFRLSLLRPPFSSPLPSFTPIRLFPFHALASFTPFASLHYFTSSHPSLFPEQYAERKFPNLSLRMGKLPRMGWNRYRPLPQARRVGGTYPRPTSRQGRTGSSRQSEEEGYDKGGTRGGSQEGCGVDLQGSEEGVAEGLGRAIRYGQQDAEVFQVMELPVTHGSPSYREEAPNAQNGYRWTSCRSL